MQKRPPVRTASASCYRLAKNVGILAVVEAKLKLIQVQRQIFLAHVVISANDSTLEQRPKRIEVLGNRPAQARGFLDLGFGLGGF